MDEGISQITAKLLKFIDVDRAKLKSGIVEFGRPDGDPPRGNRFRVSPNFRVPSLRPERPISSDGRVAFHFRHSVAVKEASYGPAEKQKPARHAVIVTAEGTSVSTNAAGYDRYISRGGSVLTCNGYAGGSAIFTNIHSDGDRRAAFWDAVTMCERNPTADVVTLYPERLSEDQWAEIVESYDGPDAIMSGLERVQADRFTRLIAIPGGERGKVSFKLRNHEFEKFRQHLKQLEAWDFDRPAAAIKRGRAGRIQRRMVAELPVGLDHLAMSRIAQRFGEFLGSKSMMYTVVVHAPDAHNDKRNYHLHAATYDRPCKYLEEQGCWDFEFNEPVPGQYRRRRFPHRQNKNGWMTRPTDGGDFRQYAADVIMELREVYAGFCNEELAQGGVQRLFDHRSYEKMGIEQNPAKRMSKRDALLEAAGVPTAQGTENAEWSWQAALVREAKPLVRRRKARRECRARATKALSEAKASLGMTSDVAELELQLSQFDELNSTAGKWEWDLFGLRFAKRMACSRAEKAYDVCQRLIDSIEAGFAKAEDYRWEDEIRERQKSAQDHLDLIDAIIFGPMMLVYESHGHLADQVPKIEEAMNNIQSLAAKVEVETAKALQSEHASPGHKKSDQISPRQVGQSSNLHPALRAYFEAPLDYEEEWDRAFHRISMEELEIEAPSEKCDRYHVSGISEEELERLLNPIFAQRSQSRLKVMHAKQKAFSAEASREINKPVAHHDELVARYPKSQENSLPSSDRNDDALKGTSSEKDGQPEASQNEDSYLGHSFQRQTGNER